MCVLVSLCACVLVACLLVLTFTRPRIQDITKAGFEDAALAIRLTFADLQSEFDCVKDELPEDICVTPHRPYSIKKTK